MGQKKVMNASTGETATLVLTPADETAHAQRATDAVSDKAAKDAAKAVKKTKNDATLAKLGITQQEWDDLQSE